MKFEDSDGNECSTGTRSGEGNFIEAGRELIVVTKPNVGLRVKRDVITSAYIISHNIW